MERNETNREEALFDMTFTLEEKDYYSFKWLEGKGNYEKKEKKYRIYGAICIVLAIAAALGYQTKIEGYKWFIAFALVLLLAGLFIITQLPTAYRNRLRQDAHNELSLIYI